MATPLTGSSVASTYTGLLKTSDNASLSGTLKSVSDGGGTDSSLQLSTTAANIVGDFSVATSKLTVASASGNTGIAGTLNVAGATSLGSSLAVTGLATIGSTLGVTGATTLSSTLAVTGATTISSTLLVIGNISTGGAGSLIIGSNLSVYGSITQTNAAASSNLAGNLTVGTGTTLNTLTCNGLATFNGGVDIPGAVYFGDTLNVVGAATFSSTIAATGTISTSGNLFATGNLTVNGNSTIGNAGTDLLTVNANVVTFPNITTQTPALSTDKILILDAASRLRVVTVSDVSPNASNSPQSNQAVYNARVIVAASTTGSGADLMTVTITPRSTSSKILFSAVINYSCKTGFSKNLVFRVTKNGNPIGTSAGTGIAGIGSASYEDGEVEAINNVKIEFFDSPSSTSLVTYKVHVYGSSGNLYLNYNVDGSVQQSTTSTITALEYFA